MVVRPNGNAVVGVTVTRLPPAPSGALQTTVVPGQFGLTVKAMVTPVAVHVPAGKQINRLGGQVIVGATGLTTTVKTQVAVPALLVATQVTVVVPTGKVEPDVTATVLPPGPIG